MGFWNILFGGGVRQIAEGAAEVGRVFAGDKAARETAQAEAYQAALGQFGAEFNRPPRSWFDGLVDGLNRLPRPILAFATIGLFAYAMNDPIGFAARMQGLAVIPDPLWWIIGAVVGFYFGARELHHFRNVRAPSGAEVRDTVSAIRDIEAIREPAADPAAEDPHTENAALADWRAARARG